MAAARQSQMAHFFDAGTEETGTVEDVDVLGCVSMLTLETAMLTIFGKTESTLFHQIILAATGVAVIGFALTMTVMIVKGSRQLKKNTAG